MATLTLPFEHQGETWQLTKHPRIASLAKAGQITPDKIALAPWYVRLNRVAHSLETGDDKEAIRRAKLRLKAKAQTPDKYTKFLAAEKAKQGVTLGTLAKEWEALRCPRANGTTRTPKQSKVVLKFLAKAWPFWSNVPAASIKIPLMSEFTAHRRATVRLGAGNATADMTLTMLSCLCEWAKATGRLDKNPFEDRPTYNNRKDVRHCHTYAPTDDEELHRLLGWLFQRKSERCTKQCTVVTGQLLFSALSGLRPGEVGALLRHAAHGQPGEVWTRTVDGQTSTMMRVSRMKGGINPAVRLHPALSSFLDTWRRWLSLNIPEAATLFPHPERPGLPYVITGEGTGGEGSRYLGLACAALGLPPRHPHGMRAFYVRVRRSQGLLDSQIGPELGHGSGSKLVTTTYGDPGASLGDGRCDWLPEPGPPCWAILEGEQSNVVPFQAAA